MRERRKGSAVVEAALMMPWIAFLFVGVLDFGFYAYAAICTQNAARAAAIRAASDNSTANICTAALGEMKGLPNTIGLASCAALPVTVTAVQLSGAACADCACSGCAVAPPTSYQASVTYQTLPMVPIPGALTGQLTLTRKAEIRAFQ